MYTTDLIAFKIQEKELHRRAEQHRLIRSLEQNNTMAARISESLGRKLILTGQLLLNNARATAH